MYVYNLKIQVHILSGIARGLKVQTAPGGKNGGYGGIRHLTTFGGGKIAV